MFIKYVIILMIPFRLYANTCTSDDSLYQSWVDQKTWSEEVHTLYSGESNAEFLFYRDSNGSLKTGPLDLSEVTYKTKIDFQFNSPTKKDIFFRFCEKGLLRLLVKDGEISDTSNLAKFKINFAFLPQSSIGTPLANVLSYSSDFRVRLYLNEKSLVKNSAYPAYPLDMLRDLIYKQINGSIEEQLAKGYNGSVVIDMDNMPALACDLLMGNAQISFLHSGERMMDKVNRYDKIELSALNDFYNDIKLSAQKINGIEQRGFLLGMMWQENSDNDTINFSIHNNPTILTDMNRFIESDLPKDLDQKRLSCIQDRAASFTNKDDFLNLFLITTQSFNEAKGE